MKSRDQRSGTALKSGQIVDLVARSRHRCSPPGWWQRRKLDIDFGTVWQCGECGERWEWAFNYAAEFWKAA